MYSVSQKKSPPRGPDIFSFFSQTIYNLYSIFYTPNKGSHHRQITNFYSIITDFDEVMPY